MAKLQLTLATAPYDRTAALLDGRVAPEGCELNCLPLSPAETFHRAFGHREFDVTEMSLATHALMTARGDSQYVGIPAFTSRAFRHSGIYIRDDRKIKNLGDLKGKTVGLAEYQQTANVFVRGMMEDDFGVKAVDVKWRTGGVEQPGRTERTPLHLPPEIDCKPIPTDQTLSQQLERGELDAYFGPNEPSCLLRGAAHVTRLFPDYEVVEQNYYGKTKIFPIMHLVGIRRSLVDAHPWLPVSLYKAFLAAKRLALEELELIGHLAVTLPWCVAELRKTRELMGDDFWSYGVEPNRLVLETFIRYATQQGLLSRSLTVEELFAPSTFSLSKE